ncbi:putative tetratricopeptide-like helical domain superfamily [Dioscorea sansibarensis]
MPQRLHLATRSAIKLRSLRKCLHSISCLSKESSLDAQKSSPENEWVRLLKPFDLAELRESLVGITPRQVCRLLELPLDVSTCLDIFNWAGAQKGYSHSFDVYFVLIRKLGEAREFKTIEFLLRKSREEGIVLRECLFIVIMKCYGCSGFPGNAVRVLDEMQVVFGCEPTFKSYNVALGILVGAGCHRMAANLFYKMLHGGVRLTTFSFSIVMKALCLMNEVEVKEALKLLEEMLVIGCSVDVDTFNDVIHGLCKFGHMHDAGKLINRMQLRGCKPNALTYGVFLQGLCKNGQVDEARTHLSRVPNSNVVLFNTVIGGYLNEGRFEEAKCLYDNMKRNGCCPDFYTYSIIINGLCKAGRLGSARQLLSKMESQFCKPNIVTYTILIDAFCKLGRWEEIEGILEEMSLKGLNLNTVTYNCLVSGLCKDGNIKEAMEFIKRMKMEGCKPDIFTYNSLLYGLCKNDQIKEAFQLYESLLTEGVVANNVTYNTMIHALLNKGQWQESMDLAKEMVFHGCSLDVVSYNGLIKALCKDGEVEKAMEMFEKMTEKDIKPSNFSYNILINGLCKLRRVQDALKLSQEMLRRGACFYKHLRHLKSRKQLVLSLICLSLAWLFSGWPSVADGHTSVEKSSLLN